MVDLKSRARVERLLRGDFRPDDLTALFLYARDHCDGRESVAEIGHFVAHHHERDKGIITRSTRRWCAVARYHFPRFAPGGPYPLQGNRLPASAREYYKTAISLFDQRIIKEKTGLKARDANDIIQNVANRLTLNPDGTFALPKFLTINEIKVVEFVSSLLVVKPAFEPDRFYDDFLSTLKSNGLITTDEIRKNENKIKYLILLYAISVMHNCIIKVDEETLIKLKVATDKINRQILVNAAIPIDFNIKVSSSMFTIDADPAVHCHPDLCTEEQFDFEIELATDGRIVPLR